MYYDIKIKAIASIDVNYGIGNENTLLYHNPIDLKHFANTTRSKVVIMGRRTYESIGKALPKRINVVLSNDRSYHAPGCTVVHSKEAALNYAASFNTDIWIIGGSHIYAMFRHDICFWSITRVYKSFNSVDTYLYRFEQGFYKSTSKHYGEFSIESWKTVNNA